MGCCFSDSAEDEESMMGEKHVIVHEPLIMREKADRVTLNDFDFEKVEENYGKIGCW